MAYECKYYKQNFKDTWIRILKSDIDLQISDTEIRGLQLRYYAKTGRKVFYLCYTVRGTGKQQNMKLGEYGLFKFSELCALAIKYKKEIQDGHDPKAEMDEKVKAEEKHRAARRPVRDVVLEYLERHSKTLTAGSYRADASLANLHVIRKIGDIMLDELDRAKLQDLYNDIKKEKTIACANHVYAFVSSFLNWCELYGYRSENSNPSKFIKREASKGIEAITLELGQYKKLFEAFNKGIEDEPYTKTAFQALQLLALTGCRHSEISGLRKDELDLENNLLRLKHRKGQRARNAIMKVPLGNPAVALLEQLRAEYPNSEYVFPSPINHDKPITDLRKAFVWSLAQAKLKHMRIHDLRHSFGTMAVDIGEDAYMLRHVLGHAQQSTTDIYLHPRDKRKISLANNVATAIVG